MKGNKHTTSISRKINRQNTLNMLSIFILIDILIFIFAAASWCYNAEISSTGKFKLSSNRYFTTADNAPDYLEEETEYSDNIKSLVFPEELRESLAETVYVHEGPDGKLLYEYCGPFLSSLFSLIYVLLLLQIIWLTEKTVTGARKIRKDLQPLDEVAFKAQILSSTAAFDPQAFDELERAINEISPAKEGAKLHTGKTEMEHLENSINNLLERMRESYQQQARFVSDASHELRTPLAVLQGYVNMLDRWGKTDEKILNESIDAIKSETEHMKKLVEQLLFLARGDSGKTKLNIEEVSLNEIMREVYEESSMIDEDHKYEFYPDARSITVSADIAMIKQTVRILIDNAAKYTPKGASIILKTQLSENGGPSFTIQDEGIGIAGSDISHMFERFFRSDPARSKDNGGAGLGLSIAKWIIERHGGYFNVISREEIGTRIKVTLPK